MISINLITAFIVFLVTNDPMSIEFMQNPSKDLCDLAVQLRAYAIQYIEVHYEDLWLKAIEQRAFAIQFLNNIQRKF